MGSRLALGTVQFGIPYGVANRNGKVGRDESAAILTLGRSRGIDTLDTAIAYGDSEEQLGVIGVSGWRVVTKLPAIPDACRDVATWVADSTAQSLRRLQVPRVFGLLLHRPADLLGNQGEPLYRALNDLKDRGLVEKVGFSIYGPEELPVLVEQFPPDLVQAPFSIVDRRLASSGWLDRLSAAGVEVHVRSVFLQGLLLMPAGDRPARFSRWSALLSRWDGWLSERGMTALQASLRFALSYPRIDRVVVGVENRHQLEAILDASDAPDAPVDVPEIASEDPDLVNPARWNVS